MPPRMRTRSASRPAAESLGGGTGERVGRHFPQMKKLSPSSRNLDTKETLNLSLMRFSNSLANICLQIFERTGQVYGALLLEVMTNQKMWNFSAYKTYLAYAIGVATPKKARKFKKPATPSKKRTLHSVSIRS
ncbi:hypothetical protein Tco_0803144 [Tanacetum coccineum]|uniref:Uncharacterized protein n=1 Tax=Tanacetum coccineum TaxID=301880 RepID=A0ABQ5A394_9ASTR